MKIKGVFLAAILTVVLCISGNLSAYSGNGDGSAESPYQISTIEDWQELMTTSDDWNKQFILTADVNLAGVTLVPVGNGSTPFTGVFDGNDNIISNAVINQPGSDYIGLFGYVIGQIRNLGIEDVNITGRNYVGGLVGNNYGGGSISNCYSTVAVSGGNCIGGLVGFNHGSSISNCYSTGLVSGNDYVGGLVGENVGSISNCYSTGTVNGSGGVGGLVGESWKTVSNCYSTGAVSGGNCIGGLMGTNAGSISNISNCYSTGLVSGNGYVGGLVGDNFGGTLTGCFWDVNTSGRTTSDGGTGKTTAQMKTLSTFTSEPNNWDFTNETVNGTDDYWRMCVDGVDYPHLNWESMAGDFACPDGVNMEDLSYFVQRWLLSDCTSANNYCGGADMDVSSAVDMKDFAMFAENWLEGI